MSHKISPHDWANRYWGSTKPPANKHEFFDAITTPAPTGDGTVATIRMYGPIDSWGGWWGISAADVGEVLDALPESVDQIVLRINSPGGLVFEAVTILNMLRAHKAKITAVVDGIAASAASVIAAGCDETVMSPGTQMMIHAPLAFMYGNANELRKEADILDGVQASIIEIYTAKAGDQDWAALLNEDTYLTAQATVDLGLADRIAVIPDAGETHTAGADDDDELVIVEPGEAEDSAAHTRAGASASGTRTPVSAEPGSTIRKENVVAYDDLKAGLAQRLGVTDADISDDALLAAVDEALNETAEDTTVVNVTAAIPEGATVVDQTVLDDLKRDAAAGREAKDAIDAARRDKIIADALKSGRITAKSKDTWRAALDKDEQETTALLATFPTNTLPVDEIGESDGVRSAEDALYDRIYGTKEES